MKPLLISAACLATAFCSPNAASQRQAQVLFNGKDLTGWHVDVPAADSNVRVRSPFVVRNGLLVSLGEPRGHLISDSSYRDYRLEIEYRFAATPGNAGVLVHASTPRALYGMFPRSIEVQMEHRNAGDFWCIVEDISVPDMERRRGPPAEWGTTEGKKRRILNLTDDSEKPAGEWNIMVIEAVGRAIRVWVNGNLVNDGADATADHGQIALQSEGSEVEFRKLLLTPITRLTTPSASRSGAAPDQLQLRTDAGRRVNAAYHLACLGRSIACTSQTFERFWHSRIGWTPADQGALDEWRAVIAEVTDRAPPRSGAPLLPNTARFHPTQAARGSIVVAAVESRSASELQQRSREVLSAPAAERLHAAIDHFERRLDPWWRSENQRRKTVEERLEGVAERARQTGMLQVMSEVAAFLEAKLTDPALHLHAIIAPNPSSKDYTATQSGSHFFVEAVDAATTDAFVHGAVHELTHYLYDSAPSERHLALVREFAESEAMSFSALYTYLNEAIAVAAQGLYADKVAARERAPETESYKHPYIQPLGAAATPLVKEAIAAQKTLFSDFAPRYIAAGTAALGNKLFEPRFVLSQVALVLPEDASRLTAAYYATMFPQASAQFRQLAEVDAFPDLNVVRFVRYDALEALADQIPDLVSLRARTGFAFAMKRGPRAHTYILAGRDTDSIIAVISRFGALERLVGSGLLFSLD